MSTTEKTAENESDRGTRKGSAVDANIGTRVRERRTAVGMSLEALGGAIGVTYQQVQKYETGANRIGAARLQDIAATLGVPVTYFFDRGAEAADEPRSRDETELLAAYRRLDPVLKRRVLDLVGSISTAPRDKAA